MTGTKPAALAYVSGRLPEAGPGGEIVDTGGRMADQPVTTLRDQDIDRLVRAAGGGHLLDQVRAVADDGTTVVVLILARPEPEPVSTGGRDTWQSGTAIVPQVELASRRHALIQRRRVVCKTQESLAIEVGVQRTTVARWESGDTTPSLWVRPPLADALDVSLDELDGILAGTSVQPRPLRAVRPIREEDLDSAIGA
jgi:DNA-binding XRE family transcriptional regulator